MDLTNDDVAEILALLDSLPYDELDLQTPRFRLTLRRAPGGWTEESQLLADPAPVTPVPNGSPTAAPSAGSTAARQPAGSPACQKSDISEMSAGVVGSAGAVGSAGVVGSAGEGRVAGGAGRAGMVAVAAPLPGTFYRAPRPGAAPFVEVGDAVTEETVVAIVETMKLMNSVHAETRGRVAEICLANAEPVAQGTILMWIEPGA